MTEKIQITMNSIFLSTLVFLDSHTQTNFSYTTTQRYIKILVNKKYLLKVKAIDFQKKKNNSKNS